MHSSSSGQALDSLVLDYLATHNLPGATLAVTRGGRLVWSKGYGYADPARGIQMQPWHRSYVASISKVLTTIGALKLTETGRLNLDHRVYGIPAPFTGTANSDWPKPVLQTGLLWDGGIHYRAILQGVTRHASPNFVHREMTTAVDWASQIRLRHLMSHTAGLLRSGDEPAAQALFGKSESELNYDELHRAMLMRVGGVPPLLFEPGSQWGYSNHGFGLLGHIMGRQLGASNDQSIQAYVQYMKAAVLHPLGLTDVVPNNTALSPLDARPHLHIQGQPSPQNPVPRTALRLGVASGGWSASARDLARLMCGLDRQSNTRRPLQAATVATMAADAVPRVANRPLGWDLRVNGFELHKGGLLHLGGRSHIIKFLPGAFASAPTDEINVAIAININHGPEITSLLRAVAAIAAEAPIPANYDLFDPAYRCFNPPLRHASEVNLALFHPMSTGLWGVDPVQASFLEFGLQATLRHQDSGIANYRWTSAECYLWLDCLLPSAQEALAQS